MPKGTLTVSDALVGILANQVSVLDFGVDLAFQQIAEENAAYNRVVQDEISTFVEISSDIERPYAGAAVIDSEDMTELDDPDASKVTGAYPIGFPLTRHGAKIAWTEDFMATNSVDTLASQYLAAQTGDQIKMQRKIRKALYYPVSRPVYSTGNTINPNGYVDRLVAPQVPRPLYPLLNADGMPVPIGPNGETFDPSTHTHYMASDWTAGGSTATTRDGDTQALCNNVTEHRVDGQLMLVVHRNDETKVRALPNFVRDYDATVNVGANLTYAGNNLDIRNTGNRKIGTFLGFEVWIKPWAIQNYLLAYAVGTNGNSCLVWRTRPGGLWSDFGTRARKFIWPITSDTLTRDGDCSVWQRHMAAILYIGGASYTAPASY